MATVPSTSVWKITDVINNTFLNQRIRDPINFLTSVPMAILRKSSSQTISNTTWISLTWNAEDIDSDNGHSTVTNTERYTSQTTGWYLVQTTIAWNGVTNTFRKMHFRKNGLDEEIYGEDTLRIRGTYQHHQTTSAYVYLDVNDYLEVRVFQDSGADLTVVSSDGDPRFEIRWVGTENLEEFEIPDDYTWSPGLLSVADANVRMRDAYLGLLMPPMAVYRIMKQKQQTRIEINPFIYGKVIEWDTVDVDSHNALDDGIFIAPRDGWYHTTLQLRFEDKGSPSSFNGGDRYFAILIDQPLGPERQRASAPAVLFNNYPVGPTGVTTDSYTVYGDVPLLKGQNICVYVDAGQPAEQLQVTPESRWTIRWVSAL